jgi:hypothetical protein
VSRWNERAKRLSAVGAKNVDLSPLARLETRANDNHRLTPVATGMPPLRGFERILGQALQPARATIRARHQRAFNLEQAELWCGRVG